MRLWSGSSRLAQLDQSALHEVEAVVAEEHLVPDEEGGGAESAARHRLLGRSAQLRLDVRTPGGLEQRARVEPRLLHDPAHHLGLAQVLALRPEGGIHGPVEGLEDPRVLGGHGGAHEQERVDGKVGIGREGNAQVGHPALEFEEAVGALGLAGLDGGRLVARRLEDAAEEHRAVAHLRAGALGERGKLGIRQVDLGEYIAPGDTIVTLLSLDRLYLDFTLPESNFRDLIIDQLIEFHVQAYPQQAFSAKVETWNPQLDANTRNIAIRAVIDNRERLLAPGMFADMSVRSRRQLEVVTVPETAIFYNIYGEAAYVLEKQPSSDESALPDYRLAARQIDVAYRSLGFAGVDSGLKSGDIVVTSGQLKLYPSLRVAIVDDVPEYKSSSQ